MTVIALHTDLEIAIMFMRDITFQVVLERRVFGSAGMFGSGVVVMSGNPHRERRAQPQSTHGDWPAWLDEDDFDGLGEEAWRAAMAALAEEEPVGLPGDADHADA